MDRLFFHLVPNAAAAVWRTAVRVWLWLVKPVFQLPPEPDERNLRGLGWAGDRPEIRKYLVDSMEDWERRKARHP